MKEESNIKKNFIWNTIGTSFNSFNSLFYMIIVTRVNGLNDAGIFTFAFSIACLFYVIGVYSGRAYQVTETNKKLTDSDYLKTKIVTCFSMIVIALLYCIFNKYSLYKISIIMFLVIYKSIEAFSESIYSVIQKNEELYKVGISIFYKSLISLILFLILDITTKNLLISEFVIIIVNILVVLIYDIPNMKNTEYVKQKFNKEKLIILLKNGFYIFISTFLTIYVINASKYAIDGVLEDKMQTIFGIIMMPATMLSLFAQFVVQPVVLSMKKLLNKSCKEFLKLNIKLILTIIVIGIVTLLVAYILGIPVLSFIYGINLDKYRTNLMIILLGAIFYSITIVFSTALTTMRYTFNQMIGYLIVTIITYITSKHLVINYGMIGASVLYMISMLILLIIYVFLFITSNKKYFNKEVKEKVK